MSLALVVNAGQVERVGATVSPEVLEVREDAGAGLDVTAAGSLEIGRSTATAINSGSGTVRWTHTGIVDHERASTAEGGVNIAEVIELNSTGTGAEQASIIIGDGSPNGNVTSGLAGSLFLDGANGAVYVKTDDTSAWTQLGSGGSSTLQQAYDAGRTIDIGSVTETQPVAITNSTNANGGLTISQTFAGGGVAAAITMGASSTGSAFDITMTTGAAGDAVRITDGTEEIRLNLSGILNSQATTYATDDNAAADGSNGFQITIQPGAGADSPGGGTAGGIGGNINRNGGTGGAGGAGANEFGGNGGQVLSTGGTGGAGGGVGGGAGGVVQNLGGTGAAADGPFAAVGGNVISRGGTGGAGSGAVAGGAGGQGQLTGGTGGLAGTGDGGDGGDIVITSGSAGGVGGGTTGGAAGDITLVVGTSTGNNNGGAITATAGAGSSAAAGGDGGGITHTTGAGADSTGAAGGGDAGVWAVVTGDGGDVITGFTAGSGGDATFNLGDSITAVGGAGAANGGSFLVNAGDASSPVTSGTGGSVTLNAGNGDGAAGVVAINGGNATGSAAGGAVTITAGDGGTGNPGGAFTGAGGTSSGTGGAARLLGGAGTTIGGDVILTPGGGTTDGDIEIGLSTTNAINSGNSTDEPRWTHTGVFDLTQATTAEGGVNFVESIELNGTGTGAETASIMLGDSNPNGNVTTGDVGSLFIDAANAVLYMKTAAASTWTAFSAGASQTLDEVITGGTPDNDVSIPSANPVIFRDGGVADFTVMSIITTATDTTPGHGLLISMGAQKDGDALNITNAGDGAAIFANNTGAGNALQVQDGGGDVLVISGVGAVDITPTTGQSLQAAADATDLTAAVDLDGTAGASVRSTSAGTATAGDVELSSESTAAGSTAGNVLVGSFASAGTSGGLELRAGGTAFGSPVEGEINIVATDIIDIDADTVTVDTTSSISLDAVTTINATVTGNSAGATDVDIIATNAGAGTGNVNLTADDDIFFDGNGAAAPIPINDTTDVDLDAGFTSGSIVGALNELLSGPAATTQYAGTVNGTTGISAGEPVALMNDGGNPRLFQADANAGDQTENAVGIALTTQGTGTALQVVVAGEVATPDAAWTGGVPATTNVGDPVFVSDTVGRLTLTAPGGASRVLKIGVVSFGGTGAVRVMVNAPDSIKL